MNTDTTPNNLPEELDDDFENIAEQHRMAAHHFKQAARHHLLAADANESGDPELTARHAFLAYRHRLAASQYAEIAALDDDSLDDLDSHDEGDLEDEGYDIDTEATHEKP